MNKTEEYEYTKLKGFSKLFIDYIADNKFIKSRFPNNDSLYNRTGFLSDIASQYPFREKLKGIIDSSMSCLELSGNQKTNLDSILKSNTLTVCTGQQVGYLGGPLYTLIKIFSCISMAEELGNKHSDLNFIPIFWLEDNDHDSHEASHTYCLNKNGNISRYSCIDSTAQTDKIIVAEKKFDDDIKDKIDDFLNDLNSTEFTQPLRELLHEAFIPGEFWNNAFLKLLQNIAGEKGILFIKASQIIKSGLCKPLIIKEIVGKGNSDKLIQSANELLSKNDYHIQAKHFPINLFYHEYNIRQKISPYEDYSIFRIGESELTYLELLELTENQPERFSPNVLLRPVFQDFILPSAAYIGGPSEIGYISQTKELFEYFDVKKAAYLSRHSATIIDRKGARILDQYNLSPAFFHSDPDDIEFDLLSKLKDDHINQKIDTEIDNLKSSLHRISEIALTYDPNIAQLVSSSGAKLDQICDTIIKKINSAIKKNNEVQLNRYKYCSNLLYPMNTLQERILSPLYFVNMYGKDQFIKTLEQICSQNRKAHIFVNI